METLRVYLGNLRETSGVLGNLQSCFKDGMKRSYGFGKTSRKLTFLGKLWEQVLNIISE